MVRSSLMTKHHFRVTGKITQLLGREALSNDFEAINELLRNCNDADALSATVNFDFTKAPQIRIVEEKGDGMTYDQIVNNFLVIGTYDKTPKKSDEPRITKRLKRVMIGRKGVGRFALEKLGNSVEIISKPINSRKKFTFEIDWKKFEGRKTTVDEVPITIYEEERDRNEDSGLEITIRNLREEWNQEKIEDVGNSLKDLVLPKELQPKNSFNIYYQSSYFGISKTRLIPELYEKAFFELHAKLRKTKIIIETKILGRRYFNQEFDTIALFENAKETKKVSDLVCGPAQLTVYYFPEYSKTDPLKEHYYEKAQKYYGESFHNNIKSRMANFHGVRIHQDGVRQFKYGDPEYDITRREIITRRMAGTIQANALIGFCLISGETNPDIIPTVNRMEAIDNQAFRDLKEFILFSMRRLDNKMNQDRDKLYEDHKNKQEASVRDLGRASKTLGVSKVQRALKKVGEDPEELLSTIKTAKRIMQGKVRQNVTESNLTLQDSIEQSLGEWVDRVYHDYVIAVMGDMNESKDQLVNLEKTITDDTFQENVEILKDTNEIINYFFDAIDAFTKEMQSENFWSSPKLATINLHKYVETVFTKTRKLLEIDEDKVILERNFSEKLDFTIFKPTLFSILYNLFSNAMKALVDSRDNEKPGSDPKRIQVRVLGLQKANFTIFISDDSTKGLSPRDNEIVFDKRISRTYKAGHGQGLGLYNLRQMLHYFDGDIEIVTPHFGKGTTIKVTLPASNIKRT